MSGLVLAIGAAVVALAALTCALGGVLWVTSEQLGRLTDRVADLERERAADLDDRSLTAELLGDPHDAPTVTVPVLDDATPTVLAAYPGVRCLAHGRAGCALCWPPGG